MSGIKFGTSGWRGIIAEEFTVEKVRVVVQAVADYLSSHGMGHKGVLVGYDSRFMGEWFAREAVRVLAARNIKSYLTQRETPTPVISFEIIRRGLAGAINFTASHNPPEYNGLKFSPSWGGPALPETTSWIERRANELAGQFTVREELSFQHIEAEGRVETIDCRKEYLASLKEKIDFVTIGKSGLKIIIDPLYGAGRGYLDTVLDEAGLKCKVIHDFRDPYFGNNPPEPSEKVLKEMIAWMRDEPKYTLGISVDGDADRFGIVDRGGTYITPNLILAVIYQYLLVHKGMKGGVARSCATTHILDRIAKKHGQHAFETPVGFKYIGEMLAEGTIIFGGEESAGLSMAGHVPEKDGILACLLVTEMVARRGIPVTEMIQEVFKDVGPLYSDRKNYVITPEVRRNFAERLRHVPASFAGLKVLDTKTQDGVKIYLENDCWLLFRESGTEPVVRIYAEAESTAKLDELLTAGRVFAIGE